MYKDIKEKLKKNLSSKRFEHSIHVAETAERLANLHCADPRKAYLAGLLHDCGREISEEKLLRYIAKYKVAATEYEAMYPVLLHSRVGASIAEREYGVTDADILDAIIRHTAGGANMSELAKVVFVADFIEPGREDEITKNVSQLANVNINRAVYEKAKYMLEFSKREKEKVHPEVMATVEYYKNA